jgi:hypothetical protein
MAENAPHLTKDINLRSQKLSNPKMKTPKKNSQTSNKEDKISSAETRSKSRQDFYS